MRVRWFSSPHIITHYISLKAKTSEPNGTLIIALYRLEYVYMSVYVCACVYVPLYHMCLI